jgi:hypothetical protein
MQMAMESVEEEVKGLVGGRNVVCSARCYQKIRQGYLNDLQ